MSTLNNHTVVEDNHGTFDAEASARMICATLMSSRNVVGFSRKVLCHQRWR